MPLRSPGLAPIPATARQLGRDFAWRSGAAAHTVRALYAALEAARDPGVERCRDRWQLLAAPAWGCQGEDFARAVVEIGTGLGIASALRPADLFFSLSTYYALLVKLVAARWADPAHALAALPAAGGDGCSSSRLRQRLAEWESRQVLGPLDPADPEAADPFAWYVRAWTEPLAGSIRGLLARLAQYGPRCSADEDLLESLYQELFPRRLRHALGEYYTPRWLAEHLLDQAGYLGDSTQRLLDPACGSGTFLLAALGRARGKVSAGGAMADGRALQGAIVGFDLNPLAVLAARANYRLALGALALGAAPGEIPIYLRDTVLAPPAAAGPGAGCFDFVVGNPPWIAWDHLSAEYREATKPLWEQYGLFSLSGTDARHGGGKKDLAMLMVYVAADRYLCSGGRLAMLVTQTAFQTKAGDGFRRFRLGRDGPWLRVHRVEDLVAMRPFAGAANWTSLMVLEKGSRTHYPVPYVKWLPLEAADGSRPGPRQRKAGSAARPPWRQRLYRAGPVDPSVPSSPWILLPDGWTRPLASLVARSDYRAHLGANTGGANGVYWLEALSWEAEGVRVRNLAARGRA